MKTILGATCPFVPNSSKATDQDSCKKLRGYVFEANTSVVRIFSLVSLLFIRSEIKISKPLGKASESQVRRNTVVSGLTRDGE